jgi:hypothetical protein
MRLSPGGCRVGGYRDGHVEESAMKAIDCYADLYRALMEAHDLAQSVERLSKSDWEKRRAREVSARIDSAKKSLDRLHSLADFAERCGRDYKALFDTESELVTAGAPDPGLVDADQAVVAEICAEQL